MDCIVQRPTLGQSFWKDLPASELSATMTANLKDFVSYEELIDACKRSDELIVLECGDATIVGIDAPGLVTPNGQAAVETFVETHPDYWVILPEEGSPIEYVEDQLCASEAISFPRLVEFEKGRESDPAGLLFGITSALNLRRASYDATASTVTYY